MRLPLSIDKSYLSTFSKEKVFSELSLVESQKKFGGLRVDKFAISVTDSSFQIQRYSNGLDGFTLGQFPLINGEFISERPTILNIKLKPNYITIIFFSIFVITFIPLGIFLDKMTINGVFRAPTILERLMFAGLGGIVPGLWCYFGYIRPIKKAELWIINRLNLTPIENNGS